MSKLLSYIIPFYNGENTILKSIDSIYAIGLDNNDFEIIVIDDCSPTPADCILADYLSRHANLRIIRHAYNKRQGGAKNTGIRAAKGEYIAFADQDDKVVSANVIKALRFAIDNKVDMLACHYYIKKEDGTMREDGIQTGEGKIMSGKEFCENHFVTGYNLAPWANLYRREFLLEINHPYEENVVMEDSDWIAWHWIHAEIVGVWNNPIYTWVMNPDSITHSHHYVNRADWIKFGYRKMRDAEMYSHLSKQFSDTMFNDGKENVRGGFLKLWKVDSYLKFYKHLGKPILITLQAMSWTLPVRILIMHPQIACVILYPVGGILKVINNILYKFKSYVKN